MVKYVPQLSSVVLEEIPDKLTLAVSISKCRGRCAGCHSPGLREDVGEELTAERIDKLFEDNFGINCFLFLGEGDDPDTLVRLADYVRTAHGVKVALYSGRPDVEDRLWRSFDYVKLGPYVPELGPINTPGTNQRLYMVSRSPSGECVRTDITHRFWHRGLERSQG